MNIAVLSHIYPGEGVSEQFTPVVHYFAREWVKLGHRVIVLHSNAYFPRFYYWAPKWVKRIVINKYKCALPENRLTKSMVYILDGVKVFRWSLFKLAPSSIYSEKTMKSEFDSFVRFLRKESFKPDVVVSHWVNPQIYLAHMIKRDFECKSILVLHDSGLKIKKFRKWEQLLEDVDVWGYRSISIKDDFCRLFHVTKPMFRCFSGVPDSYIRKENNRSWSTVNKYVFVGALMQRKFPDVAIKAIVDSYINEDFSFNIIGEGPLRQELDSQIMQLGKTKEIRLAGRMARSEILKVLDNSDIFVMISKFEVFGLVYIEAMARGCIVIASRNEGMQGIIMNGKNGFLCNAGDEIELKLLISQIKSLSVEESKAISDEAVRTASRFTDSAVAQDYLNNIIRQQ